MFKNFTLYKSLLLTLMLVLFSGNAFSDDTEVLTIGTGTSSSDYAPINRYWNYSLAMQTYLQSELGDPKEITKIAFYKASGTDLNSIQDVTIYMKHVSYTNITVPYTYDTDDYEVVWEGDYPNNASSGWMEVELDTPFEYNGTDNLEIMFTKDYQAYISARPYWRYSSTSSNYLTAYRYYDSPSYIPTEATSRTYNRPNIKITYIPQLPDLSVNKIITPPAPIQLGQNFIQAEFKNVDKGKVKSFRARWSINGVEQTSINWSNATDPLENGDAVTLDLGYVNIAYGEDGPFDPFEIVVWFDNLNNQSKPDQNPANDTKSVSISPPMNDASVVAFTSPSGTIEPGTYDIWVEIKNHAPKPLTTLQIQWTVDGVIQAPKNWMGNVKMNETTTINIGSYDISVKSPLEAYTFKANVNLPNGVEDQQKSNDSYTTQFAVSLIAGNYTIGGPTATFSSIKTCTDYLNASGIVGDGTCTFTINNDTYTGPIILDDFPKGNNKFVFQSAGGIPGNVILNADGYSEFLVKINNIPNVEFHGITFNGSSTATEIFNLNNSSNFVLNNVIINGTSGGGTLPNYNIVNAMNSDNLKFDKVTFNSGATSIYASGTNTIWVDNCKFFNFENGAINQITNGSSEVNVTNNSFESEVGISPIFGIMVGDGARIYNNSFTGIGGESNPAGYVVKIGGILSGITNKENNDKVLASSSNSISKNSIPLAKNVTGIYVNSNLSTEISDNSITLSNSDMYANVYGIMATGLNGSDLKLMNNDLFVNDGDAIYVDGAKIGANKNTIKAKSISKTGIYAMQANNSSGIIGLNMIVGSDAGGLMLQNSNALKVIYNSVNAQVAGSPAIMIDGGMNYIYRNIFSNSHSSGLAVSANNIDKGDLDMDENNIYTQNVNVFGSYNMLNLGHLTDWIAMSGQDKNSSDINPLFAQQDVLMLTKYNPGLLQFTPLNINLTDAERAMYETYDWNGDNRIEQGSFYYGIDNIQPVVIIEENPEEVIVCSDETEAEMFVSAYATLGAEAFYQWYKDGIPLENTNSSYLKFTNLDYDLSGVYYCVIGATGGAVPQRSKAAALYVLTDPDITQEPVETTYAKVGDVVKYNIKAHYRGYSEEDAAVPIFQHKIQWYRVNETVGSIAPLVDDEVISGSKSAILTFNGMRDKDFNMTSDYYFAIVTGQCGEDSTIKARIFGSPDVEITSQPVDVESCEATEATFNVGAGLVNGATDLAYQWYFEGNALTNDAKFSGVNSNELIINNIVAEDAGNYYCEVTAQPNDLKAISQMAELYVKLLPYITEPVEFNIMVEKEGDKVELHLPIGGEAPLYFVWEKEGAGVVLEGNGADTYVIESMTKEDEGFYSCRITNECGETVVTDMFNVLLKSGGISSVTEVSKDGIKLFSPVPNPVSGVAEIKFEAPQPMNVVLTLVDEKGTQVAEIYNGTATAGINTVSFNFNNVSSGAYYYMLNAQGTILTNKVMVIK